METGQRENINLLRNKLIQQFCKLADSYLQWLEEKIKEGDGFMKVSPDRTLQLIEGLDSFLRGREVKHDEESRGDRDLGETSRGLSKCNRGGGEETGESEKGGETYQTGD